MRCVLLNSVTVIEVIVCNLTWEAVMSRSKPVLPMDEAVAIEVFGLNMFCCLGLLGMDIDTLATRAEVNRIILVQYKSGEGNLTRERIEAIANVFGLKSSILTQDYKDEEREGILRQALLDAKMLLPDASTEVDAGDAAAASAEDAEDTTAEPDDEESGEVEAADAEGSEASVLDMVAPVWDADGFVATLGEKTFDLKEKATRRLVMGHIRAAKGDQKIKELVEAAAIEKPSSWFSSVENGNSRISQSELERLADVCGTTVGILLTGRGLDREKMQPAYRRNGGATPQEVIELPRVSDTERNEWFRNRVLRKKTEPAEGKTVGELLALARNPESVDWAEAWLEYTEEGARIKKFIEQKRKVIGGYAAPLQVLVLKGLCACLEKDADAD